MQPATASHRPWALTGPTDDVLRIGDRRLPLATIRGFDLSVEDERDFLASLLSYTLYLILAAACLVLVVQAGWRDRFLIGCGFTALIAISNLIDIGRATRIRLYRLRLTCADGTITDFVSPKASEVEALSALLRRTLGN